VEFQVATAVRADERFGIAMLMQGSLEPEVIFPMYQIPCTSPMLGMVAAVCAVIFYSAH
jgi:hypothetical protein